MVMLLTRLALLVQEHAAEAVQEHGPASPFDLEFGLIFWTWLVFLALLFVLSKYALPPILRATEERERKIASQLEDAQRANADAQQALDEHRQLLSGARDESAKLVAEARLVAERERESLLAKARQEQENILDRAKREIVAERDRAVAQLRREAVELSLAAAAKLIEANLDNAANRKMVEDFIASVEKSG
jgi:F-type H+-transporting ATPase subunit b